MKLRYLLFLLISGCLSLFKANAQIDSLENQLNNCQIDSVKLQLLTDLNWLYLSSNLTRAKQYAEDELLLAQKTNNQKFIAQAYNDLGIVCIKQIQRGAKLAPKST
jgi:hypothetical protein